MVNAWRPSSLAQRRKCWVALPCVRREKRRRKDDRTGGGSDESKKKEPFKEPFLKVGGTHLALFRRKKSGEIPSVNGRGNLNKRGMGSERCGELSREWVSLKRKVKL